jgi:hypothetical protein
MPLYFSDIFDGTRLLRDEEGTELPDREAARREATGVLLDIARERLPDGNGRNFTADVRNETGQVIFTATVSLTAQWID